MSGSDTGDTRYDDTRHADGRHVDTAHDPDYTHAAGHDEDVRDEEAAREKFGGVNVGAAFFGWLVAMAVAIILTSIVGAVLAAVGSSADVSQTEAQRQAGTIGLVAGIVLIAVLLIAYYSGGYVAGRMSRFDGARQGVAVWGIGLLVTVIAVVIGAAFGAQYNILDRVSLPRIPIPTDQMTTGGIITALVLLVGTLLAAILGGSVGRRYHTRVDRAAYR